MTTTRNSGTRQHTTTSIEWDFNHTGEVMLQQTIFVRRLPRTIFSFSYDSSLLPFDPITCFTFYLFHPYLFSSIGLS